MEKLHSYQGFSGRFHEWRDDLKAKFANWREDHEGESLVDLAKNTARKSNETGGADKEDYSHIYRSVMHALTLPPSPNQLPANGGGRKIDD
jgi:solute carrier family 45, member 1/2/4